MSSAMEFASSQEEREGGGEMTEQLDLIPVKRLLLPRELFLSTAVSLKNQVVEVTWKRRRDDNIGVDPTAYTGLLGTALTCLRSYEATGSLPDLHLCSDIVDTCSLAARASHRHLTFLCGRVGVYAVGAVVSHYMGDPQRLDMFFNLFLQAAQEKALPIGPEEGGFGMSYDLLYGRAGFLWAALFINKHLGEQKFPHDLLMSIVDAVLAGGRVGASDNPDCPLMYRWHGTRYYGAANGLAGILHVLLHFPLSNEDADDVKRTLRYLISKRFPHCGNYPSSEGNPRDKFVQWSHGATGIGITLCKASQVFHEDREFRDAAIEAGEVVWKNGLVKEVGLADGVSGNAYAFLSLHRLTGESEYEERARAFGTYLYHNASKLVGAESQNGGDRLYSLFHGLAGTACLWFDLCKPEESRFPGYEL
ncbi:lanC-like protein GCL1 [Cucurbita pepo subsp. pepo]|uniref:lanC-like protein GCL1 n=1 Tax=Cucurbita pepo subsp. pepo TaxID=3664 RepID=UPI000C9D7885|nr:lanC-like protein GCL1 [Cucurbita pepo subsp. pepo]XP_023514036.1 lanC-like protein GCL1 [Cucurbita pepo subsp. pepo]XP_023514045.1 lanC-like protein GCL1 [Cucurbita pepo subsp. pepo]